MKMHTHITNHTEPGLREKKYSISHFPMGRGQVPSFALLNGQPCNGRVVFFVMLFGNQPVRYLYLFNLFFVQFVFYTRHAARYTTVEFKFDDVVVMTRAAADLVGCLGAEAIHRQ